MRRRQAITMTVGMAGEQTQQQWSDSSSERAREAEGRRDGGRERCETASWQENREEGTGRAMRGPEEGERGGRDSSCEWTVGMETGGSIDNVVTTHIRCCGHQVRSAVKMCAWQAGRVLF